MSLYNLAPDRQQAAATDSMTSRAVGDAVKTKVISRQSLQPSAAVEGLYRVTLSITDATTAPVPGPEYIWFYDDLLRSNNVILAQLTASLRASLVLLPHLAGRLEEIAFEPGGDWTGRGGRLQAVFGSEANPPGVQLTVLACDTPLAEVIPGAGDRGQLWHSGRVPFSLFRGDDNRLALDDGHTLDGLPVAKITITTFPCGGLAVAAKVVHPLCDAESLMTLMHTWSTTHAKMFNDAENGIPEPRFQPDLVMSHASGDINASSPDLNLKQVARQLPLHQYDWWASADGCPSLLRWRTEPPAKLKRPDSGQSSCDSDSSGTPIPWADVDFETPISSYTILFSRAEVEAMYLEAASPTCATPSAPDTISRLDALLAHIWGLVIRARGLPTTDTVYANMVVGFRGRTSPPLPPGFVGCPATLAYARAAAADAVGSLPTLAAACRSTVTAFTPTTIGAFLHDAAHQIECRRFWGTCPSRHHVTTTSWLHHRMYDVNFGIAGCRPRWVEPIMPAYLVCGTEGPSSEQRAIDSKVELPWYADGATVSIHFESHVVERVISDPLLRRFDRP